MKRNTSKRLYSKTAKRGDKSPITYLFCSFLESSFLAERIFLGSLRRQGMNRAGSWFPVPELFLPLYCFCFLLVFFLFLGNKGPSGWRVVTPVTRPWESCLLIFASSSSVWYLFERDNGLSCIRLYVLVLVPAE